MRLLSAGAALGSIMLLSSGASASNIEVWACSPDCFSAGVLNTPPTQLLAPAASPIAFAGTVGNFTVTGSAQAGTNTGGAFFDSQNTTISSVSGGGTIDLFFSLTGVVRPSIPIVPFSSSFTSNEQVGSNHTVTFSTWYDNLDRPNAPINNLAGPTAINSSTPDTLGPFPTLVSNLSSTPSFLEVYQIDLTGCGSTPQTECLANLTIHLTAGPTGGVPEPAALTLLGTGLLGLGAVTMRRRR